MINLSNNTQPYDVVVFGAGPAGMATATTLKLINEKLNICVLDTRPETTRHYALSIAKDSMKSINETLKNNLREDNQANHDKIKSFIKFFDGWKNTTISVKEIEATLAQKAKALGITILREKVFEEAITKEKIDLLLEPELKNAENMKLTAVQTELRNICKNAKVIVGADGAHSVVRKRFMKGGDEEKKVEVENLQYFIELKYETLPQTKRRKLISKESTCEGIAFETMPKEKPETDPLKPATIHFFVGKTTYDKFPATKDQAWNLETLQEEASKDPIIANHALKIAHYLKTVLDREGSCINPKIKGLPITIYRSPQAATLYSSKVITNVGDSLAGAVFARGVNKAFKEAALLAQAISDFFKNNGPDKLVENALKEVDISKELPAEFDKYQKLTQAIFAEEKGWAKWKAKWAQRARLTLRYVIKPLRWLFSPLSKLVDKVSSLFYKKVTLGELMELLQRDGNTPQAAPKNIKMAKTI